MQWCAPIAFYIILLKYGHFVCYIFFFFPQGHTRNKNFPDVPAIPVAVVLDGVDMVFRSRRLFILDEIVRVQSQRPRQRQKLLLQQHL